MKWLVLAVVMSWPLPVLAAPCTDDHWQPTFVHDLDNDDGPYYVAASGPFQKLNWQSSGGYVPHACQLIRGPQDVRDLRGYTNCHEYTRIQCGCSRTLPGNHTCAAFLQSHSATSAAPASSVSRPPTPVSVPMTPGSWLQAPQYVANITANNAGLVLQGGAWTNGRLENNYYDGNRIYSREVFDFSAGGDAYMRFMANGGGKYMGVWPRVVEGVSVPPLTTDHSWANSVVLPENTWIYAHLKVAPDGTWAIAVALDEYDDGGGRVIYQTAGRFVYPRGRLELQFADNYAGSGASVTIGDARVVAAGSAVAVAPTAIPVPAATPVPGGPSRGLRAGGAQCSADADCSSSICLLGVCAPPAPSTPRRF